MKNYKNIKNIYSINLSSLCSNKSCGSTSPALREKDITIETKFKKIIFLNFSKIV